MAYSDIVAAINAAEATLAAVVANPKASYNIDGQSVDYNGYIASLTAGIAQMKKFAQGYQPYRIRQVHRQTMGF